jgi:trehalose-phosphatase
LGGVKEGVVNHLFKEWESIRAKIRQAQTLFLFLDYDGTITPIVSSPELALCPQEVKALLEELRDSPNVLLAIISGRSLEDIREKVGIPGLIYVGNHGLDIQNPAGVHKKKLSPPREKELRKIVQTLEKSFGKIPGILFEDKGPILAIHYRNVAQKYFGWIHQVLKETMEKWKGRWKIAHGKMVFEIRPEVDFHKGTAVKEILKGTTKNLLPIYLGDDQTDEDAFREVKGRGISVFVGPGWLTSEAEYYLKNPAEVQAFLLRCEEIMRDKMQQS